MYWAAARRAMCSSWVRVAAVVGWVLGEAVPRRIVWGDIMFGCLGLLVTAMKYEMGRVGVTLSAVSLGSCHVEASRGVEVG